MEIRHRLNLPLYLNKKLNFYGNVEDNNLEEMKYV